MNNMDLGEKIKQFRMSKGLSLAKFGKIIGYSASGLHHIENEKRQINGMALLRLLKVFNISIFYFLENVKKHKCNCGFCEIGKN